MRNNRLLVIAIILIAFGLIGIFTTSWIGGYRSFTGWIPSMIDGRMMRRGMMGDMRQLMQWIGGQEVVVGMVTLGRRI
jgi:hypothetical protein